MATYLGALGKVVSDRTFVLNLIRGLNERFTNIGVHLRRGRPFPTFKEAQAELVLEEMNMAHRSPSTFVTSSAPKPATGSWGAGPGAPPAVPKSKNWRSKHGGGGGKAPDAGAASGGGQTVGAKAVSTTWPSF